MSPGEWVVLVVKAVDKYRLGDVREMCRIIEALARDDEKRKAVIADHSRKATI